MASKAKQSICDAAVKLFNEQGYSSVSLRQIASEAGTTIGNLTYHFAKKDDLLQAILSDVHAGFSGMLDRALRGEDLARHLVMLICENERNETTYPFYYENIAEITRQSPALRDEGSRFAQELCSYYTDALQSLWDDGWLRNDISRSTLGTTAYTLVQMEAGWVESNAPYCNDLLPKIGVAQACCQLLSSYMSAERLPAFLRICREVNIGL